MQLTQNVQAIPFSFPDVYEGFADAEGLIRLEGSEVILEYEVKDGFVGVVKSGLKEIRLPLQEIDSLHSKRNIFRSMLFIRPRSLNSIKDVPGLKNGEMRIKFSRKHREEAEHFAANVSLLLNQQRLEELDRNLGEKFDQSLPNS